MQTISEFAKSRGATPATVRQYIDRHQEIKEHTHRKGKERVLEDEAIELLEKAYPLPQPVEVIEDTESRRMLIEAQQAIIQLQKTVTEQAAAIAQAEAAKRLIEDKEKLIAERDRRIAQLEADVENEQHYKEKYESRANELIKEKYELAAELEVLRKRKWWQLLFK